MSRLWSHALSFLLFCLDLVCIIDGNFDQNSTTPFEIGHSTHLK